MLILH
jgi:hypothetical protein